MVFSAISGVMVIDGMDPHYLHVQETSADSTWQPVLPPVTSPVNDPVGLPP